MTQNRSSAVMQQKRPESAGSSGRAVAPRALNYFPTPPFATRALCEFLEQEVANLRSLVCWEPACGEGHMVRPLAEYFLDVIATDVHRYGDDHALFDFTLAKFELSATDRPDFVITNPPFTLAAEFIANASAIAECGFAMLVRSAFLEGAERHRQLWSVNPPSFVLQFSERVVMLEGRLIRSGEIDPFSEQDDRRARSATSYVWLVWLQGETETRFRWIEPCRAYLERANDYPEYERPCGAESPLFGVAA